jgi:enoyl-CoA hydratase/carnithine racemase
LENEASAAESLTLSLDEAGIATITLNRPQKGNAITLETWKALRAIFVRIKTGRIAGSKRVNAIVLRGAGRGFSAGVDFDEVEGIVVRDNEAGDDYGAQEYWRVVNDTNSAIEDCPKPVIAMVHGYALGAAVALLASCDIRIASDNTRQIGVTAPQIGLTLGLNDTRRLIELIGASWTRYILLVGERFTAAEAHHMGLVTKVVPHCQSPAPLTHPVVIDL